MRRLIAVAVILVGLFSLTACSSEETVIQENDGYVLWFPVNMSSDRMDSAAVVKETQEWYKVPNAQDLMQALLDGPHTIGLHTPFPDGVSVHFISTDEKRQTIWVDLSEEYAILTGYNLTIADYCITMTLSQLPGVENVRITVEGETLTTRNRQTMRNADVLLSGTEKEPDTFLAVLYFPNRSGGLLTAEFRQVTRAEGQNAVDIVMDELLRGPMSSEGCLALPEGTRVRSLTVRDGVCSVDLSKEFVVNASLAEEEAGLTLYALINTLCVRSGVSQVQLLIEGEKVEYYGNVSASTPLSANFDLVEN